MWHLCSVKCHLSNFLKAIPYTSGRKWKEEILNLLHLIILPHCIAPCSVSGKCLKAGETAWYLPEIPQGHAAVETNGVWCVKAAHCANIIMTQDSASSPRKKLTQRSFYCRQPCRGAQNVGTKTQQRADVECSTHCTGWQHSSSGRQARHTLISLH